ncbi:hypothetical protein B0H11DRAFT_1627516, partial [Mycena galericulata]
ISGIGIRLAIHAQNPLNFILLIWVLWDGNMSEYELLGRDPRQTTFAISVSMVEVRTVGLSSFPASIVLSLSWMNTANTFTYVL